VPASSYSVENRLAVRQGVDVDLVALAIVARVQARWHTLDDPLAAVREHEKLAGIGIESQSLEQAYSALLPLT
jgi:hypothetical protein